MIPLYGKGMHCFVLRECEVGLRVAMFEDSEWYGGWSALDDVAYLQWLHQRYERAIHERGRRQADHEPAQASAATGRGAV